MNNKYNYYGAIFIIAGIGAFIFPAFFLGFIGSITGIPTEATEVNVLSNTYYLVKEPFMVADSTLKILACSSQAQSTCDNSSGDRDRTIKMEVYLNNNKIGEFLPLCKAPPNITPDNCAKVADEWKTLDSITGLNEITLPVDFSGWANITIKTPNVFQAGMPLIESLPIEIYRENELCRLQQGYLLGTETFTAGTTVRMDSFRYSVKAFCYVTPVLKLDLQTKEKLEQTVEPYKLLQKGEYVTIPAGQEWEFRYVMEVPPTLSVLCDANQVLNTTTNSCDPQPGIAYICSECIYNANEQVFVTQPDLKIVCDGVVEGDQCVKYIPQEVVLKEEPIVCDGTLVVENGVTKCRRTLTIEETEHICPAGNYDAELDKCIVLPEIESKKIEQTNFIKIALYSISGGLILLGAMIFFRKIGSKKK